VELLAFGRFTALGIRLGVYMVASVLVGLAIREWARATTATRLHDPTPRLWGRVTLNPRAWFDPFGSGLVPGLLFILWTVQLFLMPIAYAKPAPVDRSYLRRQPRDIILVSIAGPVVNLALGIAAGVAIRLGPPVEVFRFLDVFAIANFSLAVFHLLPIPGLDGARMLALTLPPHPRELYTNADKYLPLFVLLLFFFLGTLVMTIFSSLSGALCQASSGTDCLQLLGL
jgi:Zn-dependent protease